eukprot:scaffold73262_cov32-Tisochrysis_lutea.AAC.3
MGAPDAERSRPPFNFRARLPPSGERGRRDAGGGKAGPRGTGELMVPVRLKSSKSVALPQAMREERELAGRV